MGSAVLFFERPNDSASGCSRPPQLSSGAGSHYVMLSRNGESIRARFTSLEHSITTRDPGGVLTETISQAFTDADRVIIRKP
jgi:hypothetical protein